jgi:hypothetical protein
MKGELVGKLRLNFFEAQEATNLFTVLVTVCSRPQNKRKKLFLLLVTVVIFKI